MDNNETSKFAPLLHALEQGNLTPSQLSAVSASLHVGMLSSALGAIKENDELLGSLKSMEATALGFLEERFQEAIATMSYAGILEFLEQVSKIRNESVKSKLKVYSTRDLFNINPISDDDRALLSLLRLVDSGDKRQKLKDFIASLDNNTIDIPAQDVTPVAEQYEAGISTSQQVMVLQLRF